MFQRNLPPPPRKDEFVRVDDRPMFTRTMIAAGYRPYRLVSGEKEYVVWAKPVLHLLSWKTKRLATGEVVETQPNVQEETPDLSVFAEGVATRLPINGRVLDSTDVLLLDEADGGGIVTGYERTIL